MFSYLSPEERVPAKHPLRPIRLMVDDALRCLSPGMSRLYSSYGRPSIPPEKLLRALLLQVLYTIRSERMLMEQLEYNLLFRWFVGLNMDEAVWVPTVFTKNRDRLLEGDIAEKFRAFGWEAINCDGHDVSALLTSLHGAHERTGRRSVIARPRSFLAPPARWFPGHK